MSNADHKHEWIATHGTMLEAGYPNFVTRYGCTVEGCDAETFEETSGFEL